MQTKPNKYINKLSQAQEDSFELNNSEMGRQERIAVLAYEKAEKRGFVGSEADTVQDWLEAEKEIDGYDVLTAKESDK